jgi:hypothetical protein
MFPQTIDIKQLASVTGGASAGTDVNLSPKGGRPDETICFPSPRPPIDGPNPKPFGLPFSGDQK